MTKLIGIILLLVILRMAVKNFSAQLKAAVFGPPSLPKSSPPPRAVATETLVPCAACGTYIVASRGFKKGDEVFCSEECRRRGAGAA
jgi:hypothetical protein